MSINFSDQDDERVGFAFWTQVNRFWLIESKDLFTYDDQGSMHFPEYKNICIAFVKAALYWDDSELCVEGAVATEIKFDKLTLILDNNPSVDLLNLETHESATMTRRGV